MGLSRRGVLTGKKYMVIIFKVSDDVETNQYNKEFIRNLLSESVSWWHSYLGVNDNLSLDKWSIYLMEWADEIMIARILNALGKGKDYVEGKI
ncbi:hypothetical protein [Caldivirga maquilingensis]|uniref:Uncharacterized protein n=1 Tax=Caldivirga maquilingensis (strain ATCC 700844 / DSM 13496 / JCM 10307 / IC-167) TaxID=397948 RepID=A8MC34_CALMQ|nr:hypothetical protein [Caldivirga maquilingensis]ABW01340.1 hypothetical protein Cmaq_0495 [Caldivirga maquilingensis IC-167]